MLNNGKHQCQEVNPGLPTQESMFFPHHQPASDSMIKVMSWLNRRSPPIMTSSGEWCGVMERTQAVELIGPAYLVVLEVIVPFWLSFFLKWKKK